MNFRGILRFGVILLVFTSPSRPQARPFRPTDDPGRVFSDTTPGPKATNRIFATLPDGAAIAAMRVDGAGNVYLAGYFEPTAQKSDEDNSDAFVAKINSDGSKLLYFVVLAGSSSDGATALALDEAGAVYVAGVTSSRDFPTTPGALQSAFQGEYYQTFVAKLDSIGGVEYQTLFGGSSDAIASDIFVNRAREVSLTGQINGGVFPTTPGAVVGSLASSTTYVAKIDSRGSNLLVGVRGIGGRKVAADARDNIYVGGSDYGPILTTAGAFQKTHDSQLCGGTSYVPIICAYGYVTKLNATGTEILFSTFVTGSYGSDIAGMYVDAEGNVLLAGTTNSPDYPVTPGVLLDHYVASAETIPPQPEGAHPYYFPPPSSGFVTKLNKEGTALLFSTFFSGSETDMISGMVVSPGFIYVTGYANSPDLPGIKPADQTLPSFYVSQIKPDGSAVTRTRLINQPGVYEFGSRLAWRRDSAVYVAPGGPAVFLIDFSAEPGTSLRGFPRQR